MAYQVLCHLQTQDESHGTAQLSHKSAWRMSIELLTHNAGDIRDSGKAWERGYQLKLPDLSNVHCLKCISLIPRLSCVSEQKRAWYTVCIVEN